MTFCVVVGVIIVIWVGAGLGSCVESGVGSGDWRRIICLVGGISKLSEETTHPFMANTIVISNKTNNKL